MASTCTTKTEPLFLKSTFNSSSGGSCRFPGFFSPFNFQAMADATNTITRPTTITVSCEIMKVSKTGLATVSNVFTATFRNGEKRQIRRVSKHPIDVMKPQHYCGAHNERYLWQDETPLFNHDWSNERVVFPGVMLWNVTREFTGGLLKGQTHTEQTTVEFTVGFRCDRPVGGSPYVITKVEPVKIF